MRKKHPARALSAVFVCFPLCGLCVNLLHGIISRKARKDSLLATYFSIHFILPSFGQIGFTRKERKDIWNLLSLRSLRVFLFAVSA
jgi:hypothetical protein